MGHSCSRLPYPINRIIIDVVKRCLRTHHVTLEDVDFMEYHQVKSRVRSEVCSYLQSHFTPEQLEHLHLCENHTNRLTATQMNEIKRIINQTIEETIRSSVSINRTQQIGGTHRRQIQHSPASALHSRSAHLERLHYFRAYEILQSNNDSESASDACCSRPLSTEHKTDTEPVHLSDFSCSGPVRPCQLRRLSECRICLQPFVLRQIAATLPCFHVFHQRCIEHWLNKGTGCPICRIDPRNADLYMELFDKKPKDMVIILHNVGEHVAAH